MTQLFIRSSYVIALLVLCFSVGCAGDSQQSRPNQFSKQDSIKAPVTKVAGEPKVTSLISFPPKETQWNTNEVTPISAKNSFITLPRYDTEQGLALSTVLSGLKDRYGRLWFGSSGNGLNRYDGTKFTTFNSSHGLIHNYVRTLYEDTKGTIWIGTYGGLSTYDGTTFLNYTVNDGLVHNDVNRFKEDSKGRMWIATEEGVSYKLNDQFVNFPIENNGTLVSVNDMVENENGQLLFATSNGLYYLSETTNSEAAIIPYKNLPFKQRISVMIEDSHGNLWLGTDTGIFVRDPDPSEIQKPWIQYTTENGLVDDTVFSITEDSKGNIWIGTLNGISKGRMLEEDLANITFESITTERGLSHTRINDITEDDSGNLWFSTHGGGLNKYSGNAVRSYTNEQGVHGDVIGSITSRNDSTLWFASFNGILTEYDGTRFSNYGKQKELEVGFITDIMNDTDDRLWLATTVGAFEIGPNSILRYTTEQGLLDNYTISLMQDSSDALWVGSYEAGINKLMDTVVTSYTTEQGLVHNTVWSSMQDKDGIIWLATRGGLSRFDGSSFTNFTKAQGLVENKLSKIIQDSQGNLLIGSWGSGVSIVRKEYVGLLASEKNTDPYTSYFVSFNSNMGLANDVVYDIEEDSQGNIFIGSSKGITVLKGGIDTSGNRIAKEGIENYNQDTEYPIKDVANNHSMFMDDNDILWIGTGDKLVRFDYKEVQKSQQPPAVIIENIRLNNEKISWRLLQKARSKDSINESSQISVPTFMADELLVYGKKLNDLQRDSIVKRFKNVQFDSIQAANSIPTQLVLPYAFNNISFDFAGVETARPSMVQYQYKLEGYDEIWNPVTTVSTANFGNISQGIHTFMIRARSADGVWSAPLNYTFEVLPPWYRSALAFVFYSLMLIGLGLLVHRFQSNRIIATERQRTMHRELEQAKAIEKAYADLKSTQSLLIHSEKMASLGELTAGIAHEIQNPLNFVNNFSEVSNELMVEMNEEIDRGNNNEAKLIAKDIRENLEKIQHHGKRAEAIVKGMLQHSRKSSSVKEPIDINKLTDEYLRLAYHGLRAKDKSFNAVLETNFDPKMGFVSIIPQEIGRVILNLITNAFYASTQRKKQTIDPDFKPTVSVATKRLTALELASKKEFKIDRKAKGGVSISVKDNGNGIPKEVLDKIFQPFFTTKPTGQGTGLGLSMSYDIIHAHGGQLGVFTEVGKGTEFIIVLPQMN